MKNWLIALLFLIVSSCTFSPVPAKAAGEDEEDVSLIHNADGTMTITLSRAQADVCKQPGGCVLLPLTVMQEVIRIQALAMCGKDI